MEPSLLAWTRETVPLVRRVKPVTDNHVAFYSGDSLMPCLISQTPLFFAFRALFFLCQCQGLCRFRTSVLCLARAGGNIAPRLLAGA